MLTKHTFNTGRWYTDQGQSIHVELADGRCWFHDTARGIAGSFECAASQADKYTLESLVMNNYDFGNYRNERLPGPDQARVNPDGFPAP